MDVMKFGSGSLIHEISECFCPYNIQCTLEVRTLTTWNVRGNGESAWKSAIVSGFAQEVTPFNSVGDMNIVKRSFGGKRSKTSLHRV